MMYNFANCSTIHVQCTFYTYMYIQFVQCFVSTTKVQCHTCMYNVHVHLIPITIINVHVYNVQMYKNVSKFDVYIDHPGIQCK